MAAPRWIPPFDTSFEEVRARLAKAGTYQVRHATCAAEFYGYDRQLDALVLGAAEYDLPITRRLASAIAAPVER